MRGCVTSLSGLFLLPGQDDERILAATAATATPFTGDEVQCQCIAVNFALEARRNVTCAGWAAAYSHVECHLVSLDHEFFDFIVVAAPTANVEYSSPVRIQDQGHWNVGCAFP